MQGHKAPPFRKLMRAVVGPLLLLVLACGDDDKGQEDPAGGEDNVATGPVFAIGTSVFGQDTTTSYVRVVKDLDMEGKEVDLKNAYEFPGNSDLSAHEGLLLVASGDAPKLDRYRVTGELKLGKLPETLDFSNHGIASAAFWNNQFVAADKAYMLNGAAEIIVWNPQTMETAGTIALPEFKNRGALRPVTGLADRSSVAFDGKYYLPVYWTDEQYADRSDDSVIVVIDIETDTVEDTLEAGCPGLDYATVDDDGKIHFSNWTGGPGTYYVLGTAQNCIATLDPKSGTLATKTFASMTGGHEGAAFMYAGGGRFVMSVFDEERADVENAEDPFSIVAGLNWQLWSYDPETGEAGPVSGVDWNSGAVIHARIGDDLYSLVPGADYKSTTAYKLGANGTSAEVAFRIYGWSYRLFRLR